MVKDTNHLKITDTIIPGIQKTTKIVMEAIMTIKVITGIMKMTMDIIRTGVTGTEVK